MTRITDPCALVVPGRYRVTSELTAPQEIVILNRPYPNPDTSPGKSPLVSVITFPGGRRQERQLHTLGLAPHPTRGGYVATIEFLGIPSKLEFNRLQRATFLSSTAYKEAIARKLAQLFLRLNALGWTSARIEGVWVYGGIAIGKEATHDIDMGLFVDTETVWRNLELPTDGRLTLALPSEGQRLRTSLIKVLGLTSEAVERTEYLLRGLQSVERLDRTRTEGDFTAELRLIPKLDLQIWANPMPRDLRSVYNAAARTLKSDPNFSRRMASRLRLYNNDADGFDPIGAHPVQLGSPDW